MSGIKANGTAQEWAMELGLAAAPLFNDDERSDADLHQVLLDGGSGSFAVSVLPHGVQADPSTQRSWIWSADLSHHVSVTEDKVEVMRWDDPNARRAFSRSSVAKRLEPFYRFLVSDRISAGFSIVDHALDLFRRLRAVVLHQTERDDGSVHVFLFALASLIDGTADAARDHIDRLIEKFDLDPSYADLIRSLDWKSVCGLLDHYRQPRAIAGALELLPRLVVRHAGGLVFQEAHFELLSSGPPDIFGFANPPKLKLSSRGGTHFTPPSLARSIVEQAITQLEPLSSRSRLTVLDPACGSGAFLHEMLRAIRRTTYAGRIEIIGRDISPYAVAMARFVLRCARQDWPAADIQVDIQQGNSLAEERWPTADAVVMNPPFISWTALSAEQRDEVRRVLGPLYIGKADYSMAFIVRALDCVGEKGVLGTLCPASLLAASTAKRWRRHLLDSATPTLVGIIGDHGLFRHALVQVATLVLTKARSAEPGSSFVTLWTSEARGVAGEAMRTLRRVTPPGSAAITGEGWRIGRDGTASLMSENDWRPRPKRLEPLMSAIHATIPTSVGDLFDVRQGIRTGHREVFLLSRTEFDELPIHEKPFFRPAVENRNIEEGRISECDYLFYPYTIGLPPIPNEQELQRLVSTFYASRLQPNKAALAKRADLVRRTGESAARWWELSQSRPWLAKPTQKIITAYFGRAGSFAWDARGDLLVLQGHGWTPRGGLSRAFAAIREPIREKQSHLFFAAYLALLNSTIFSLLLAESCNHVAGGQFDLSKRFVDNVPLPNLADIAGDSEKGVIVAELDHIGRVIADGQLSQIVVRIDQLVATLYGVPIEQWPET